MKLIKPAILGLGYVGLPIFLKLHSKFNTLGFDINKNRVVQLKKGFDKNKEFTKKKLLLKNNSKFVKNINYLKKANFFIVTVPTPIYKNNKPDLRNIIHASNILSKVLKKGDIIFYESTVFPGVTESVCIPILEKNSNLKENKDFFVGYSPERINPGDKMHNINKINKVVAFKNKNQKSHVVKIYKNLSKKLFFTNDIKEAEASKVIENIQRDLNIGLMNEIYKVCDHSKINFKKVIKLANTKWNFIPFNPGLVGGHCLPVDPYYFSWFAKKNGINTNIILAARKTNNEMANYVFKNFLKKIRALKIKKKNIRILILGITYKKNVSDLRNSLAVNVYTLIKKSFLNTKVYDPLVQNKFKKKFNLIEKNQIQNFDIYITLTDHDCFKKIKKKLNDKIKINFFS